MNAKIRQKLDRRKKRILYRLQKAALKNLGKPVFAAANILYDVAGRARGLAHGGIGAFHLLARRLGLADAIDSRLHLLKIHLPYHESDHVLNLAFNALCEGTRIEHLELRRNDEVYLDALDALDALALPASPTPPPGDARRAWTSAATGRGDIIRW